MESDSACAGDTRKVTITYSGVLARRWAPLLGDGTVAKTGVRFGETESKAPEQPRKL